MKSREGVDTMRRCWSAGFAVGVLLLSAAMIAQAPAAGQAGRRGGGAGAPAAPPMALTVAGFPDGGVMMGRYTVSVEKPVSPPMSWTNVPAGTQSFVMHLRDPDVTRNRTAEDQMHWLLWNIPGTATSLPEGITEAAELADGTRQVSASGRVYRVPGAAANAPMHHYTFELFALDIKLEVPNAGDPFEVRKAVLEAMSGHVLGKAAYVGLYHRSP